MPTRKIGDDGEWCPAVCRHPEHNPPTMEYFEPGTYEHECPSCGNRQRFIVKPEGTLAWIGNTEYKAALLTTANERDELKAALGEAIGALKLALKPIPYKGVNKE